MSDRHPHRFWTGTPARKTRRGLFWIAMELKIAAGLARAPMFVEWGRAEHATRPFPIVLVHGGGFQDTE